MKILILSSVFLFELANAAIFPKGQYNGSCQFQVNDLQAKVCDAFFNSKLLNGTFHVSEELECSDYRQVSSDAFKFKDLTQLDWLAPSNLEKYGEGVCINGLCEMFWNNGTIQARRKMSFAESTLEYFQETVWLDGKHRQNLDCKFTSR